MKYLLSVSLATVLIITATVSYSQSTRKLQFKNMEMSVSDNVSTFNLNEYSKSSQTFNGLRHAILIFAKSPDQNTRKQLLHQGIQIGTAIPGNAYSVVLNCPVSRQNLQAAGVISIVDFPTAAKLDNRLQKPVLPAYAILQPGTIDLLLHVNASVALASIKQGLQAEKATIINESFAEFHLLTIRVPQSGINAIATLPFVEYVQPVSPKDKKLNDEVRSNSRVNILNAPLAMGGFNLQGAGVVIGIGDNADIKSHVDLADRVIDRSAFITENHGTQIAGVAAGAGIKDPLYQGIAPKATLVSQLFSGIIANSGKYTTDYGMSVTNNSYGAQEADCEYAGVYDLYSAMLDQQAFSYQNLLHVFAAGNDGTITCPGFPTGFHTVLGGYQSAKNILTVGWGEKNAVASNNGSHGPASDGRIKPEITTTGSEVRSPGINNTYVTDYGSSLSSPAVAGGAALLVERYRQINANTNPKSALVKALLMNGATDIDNPGPDFKSGFGWMNLNRSIIMLNENHIIQGTINPGVNVTHIINVPSGSSKLKAMIYWHDPATAPFVKSALVNDIDFEVINTDATVVLPWVLDTARSNVNALATHGVDHINNVEQVTIDNPAAGTYTLRVKANPSFLQSPQEYFIVYDILPTALDLTFPSVGEPLVSNETVTVNWDAWDYSPNTFTLQYSINNGSSWIDMITNLPANARQYNWVVPNVATRQGKMRVLRNGTALSNESMPFVILPQSNLTLGTQQCPGYMSAKWTTVSGATDYEVLLKKGAELVPVAVTTLLEYSLGGLNKDRTYWMTIRPRIDGAPGRRSVAISLQPNSGNCAGTISDHDLVLDSIISPASGRLLTSTQIATTTLSIRIKNLDDASVNNFTVKYSINDGPFQSQTVAATIAPLSTYTYNFNGVNFSNPGTYKITAVVKNTEPDAVTANDTLVSFIKQLPNAPISLPYVESFEAAASQEIFAKKIGLDGIEKWDFLASTSLGRIRTFVNTGIAFSGSKALTIDVASFVQTGNLNFVYGNFNMTQYHAATDVVRMDFYIEEHGRLQNQNNRVWVRGSDTNNWILAYNIDSAKTMFEGIWHKSASIQISNLLLANGQDFTSSFQVRFGQFGVIGMSDASHNGGYSLDDFRLYTAENDVAVTSIDSPLTHACGLGAAEKVSVTLQNLSKVAYNNVPIKLQVDRGAVISETVASMPANAKTNYTFNTAVNLSALGEHTIKVWLDLPSDTYRDNDSLTNFKIINQPVIDAFPYLQNFENGTGNWYAEGHNSSWQFGAPNSIKINKAASGNNAWKTTLQGTYNDKELSYLYSPCFNLSGMATPWLSMSVAMDIEQCKQEVCDQAWVEYSTDGIEWKKLGAYGEGLNWYNRPGDNVWDSSGITRWRSTGIALPTGFSSFRMRVVMNTDESLIKEGIAIDDIHIYDRTLEIYTGPSVTTPITQNVAGNNWVHFTQGNQVITSINPAGNNLGTTGVQTFVNRGGFNGVRDTNDVYFLDRNITIKPANIVNADSAIVRFYFTDAEVDTLVRATSCSTCNKPKDAYEFGITKYDDADESKENGNLGDNQSGIFSFINQGNVTKVPYDKGYYAEFKVKDFSEFWLSNKAIIGNVPLPLMLTYFNAVKQNQDVLLQWSTTKEVNVDRFEIEVARSSYEYQHQQFNLLQVVAARNNMQNVYQATDMETAKTGARYYRLKVIGKNNQVTYSAIKVVLFGNKNEWTVYPNPVTNLLQVITQAEAGKKVEIQLINTTGQVLLNKSVVATGFQDKLQLDLSTMKLPAGMYIVKVSAENEVRQFKVVKQ